MDPSPFCESIASILERELSPTECRVVRDVSCGGDQPIYLEGVGSANIDREQCRTEILVLRNQLIYAIINVVDANTSTRGIWNRFLALSLSDYFH